MTRNDTLKVGDRVFRKGDPDKTPGTVGIVQKTIVGVILDGDSTPRLITTKELERIDE